MSRTITFRLTRESIRDAIREVSDYSQFVKAKSQELNERLAVIGAREASVRFTGAMYDGLNDSDVSVESTQTGYAIVARGEAVCFIEFGTGVHHNSSEPYPNARPEGVVGIGEYGSGKGKHDTWVYKGETGGTNGVQVSENRYLTHGNPASMPMWYATEEMRRTLTDIAREVFAT